MNVITEGGLLNVLPYARQPPPRAPNVSCVEVERPKAGKRERQVLFFGKGTQGKEFTVCATGRGGRDACKRLAENILELGNLEHDSI